MLIFIFPTISAFNLTLSGLNRVAVLFKAFTLICVIENAIDMNDTVQFLRQSTRVASVQQVMYDCVGSDSDSYKVRCGQGTDTKLSDTKTYTLEIKNSSTADKTEWLCQMKNNKIKSNTYKLSLTGEYYLQVSTIYTYY